MAAIAGHDRTPASRRKRTPKFWPRAITSEPKPDMQALRARVARLAAGIVEALAHICDHAFAAHPPLLHRLPPGHVGAHQRFEHAAVGAVAQV